MQVRAASEGDADDELLSVAPLKGGRKVVCGSTRCAGTAFACKLHTEQSWVACLGGMQCPGICRCTACQFLHAATRPPIPLASGVLSIWSWGYWNDCSDRFPGVCR